jgi:serine/threonine protein kinase
MGEVELVGRLSTGKMAEVWLGRLDQEWVAVKRMLPEALSQGEGLSWFLREISLHIGLDHPNIVRAVGAVEVDDVPALALELVEGESLGAVLSALTKHGERMAPPLACLVVQRVAQGLEYLHPPSEGRPAGGVLHCDLCPGNVLLSAAGEVKLADFGLARRVGESSPGGGPQGQPGYLSPEQALGLPLDVRSDVFGLGVLLFELLTGERLFPGRDLQTCVGQLTGVARPRRVRPAYVPTEIWGVLSSMVGVDPRARLSSAGEVANQLGRALRRFTRRSDHPGQSDLAQLFSRAFPGWLSPRIRPALEEVTDGEVPSASDEGPVLAGWLLDACPQRLGSLLVAQGALTSTQLEFALHQSRGRHPLGRHLIELGLITAPQLHRALLAQRLIPHSSGIGDPGTRSPLSGSPRG